MRIEIAARKARYLGLGLLLILCLEVRAGVISYGSQDFNLINANADGSAVVSGADLIITGGNNGSGLPGTTDLVGLAPRTGTVMFDYLFTTLDIDPQTGQFFDDAGYLIGDLFAPFSPLFSATPLHAMFMVTSGQAFGFRVQTEDNTGEPGVLTISDFRISEGVPESVPEPGSGFLVFLAGTVLAMWCRLRRYVHGKSRCAFVVGLTAALAPTMPAQNQFSYAGTNATGRLVLTTVTDASQTSARLAAMPFRMIKVSTPEVKQHIVWPQRTAAPTLFAARTFASVGGPGLSVAYTNTDFSFPGLLHADQRNANNGNQFSIEPPSQEIAVGKEYVLEGVNNAIQVYSRSSGTPLLPKVLSTNELFGVSPAINRATGENGVYPTDMRVFYEYDIDRWFVMQRAQDYDAAGFPLSTSHLYVAVSQTGNPTGKYNIYVMDTTNANRYGCPCFADFPQIAADKFGVHISFDLYNSFSGFPVGASILAILKSALANGTASPVLEEFAIPFTTKFERTIRPALTPPGASYFIASGGVQFFLSTNAGSSSDNRFALWALTNTASLATTPNLTLIQKTIPGPAYSWPNVADQRPGPLPLGSDPKEYMPLRTLATIDGGHDSRILSLMYSGGRLYTTYAIQAFDQNGKPVVAGAYAILSPTYRIGTLAALVLRQGNLIVNNNHVLRPAIAVNPQGKGAVVFTLVGPDYYPSAAFVPIDTFSTSTTARVAGIGVVPEDGFSGYDPDPNNGYNWGIARWGDYSSAVATSDGSIWMAGQYTPSVPRSSDPSVPAAYGNWYAHWATRIVRFVP